MLSPYDTNAIAQAVAEAETHTSTQMAAVVAPASDPYQSFVLLYGFALGSLLDYTLWAQQTVTDFPALLGIQLAAMSLLSLIAPLRHACIRLVPKSIRHRRAAHRAFEEYLMLSRHVPASAPLVLLYVSAAERYAHILPSRAVREKIPDENWDAVIRKLTDIAPADIGQACIEAIRHCGELLAPHFPAAGA